MKRQRATLTLIDSDDGKTFSAHIQYQPSIQLRCENSPAVNAMIRIGIVLSKVKDQMGAPLVPQNMSVPANNPKKRLTFWQSVRRFLTS